MNDSVNLSRSSRLLHHVPKAMIVDKVATPSAWRLYCTIPGNNEPILFLVERSGLKYTQDAFFNYISIEDVLSFSYKIKTLRGHDYNVIVSYHHEPKTNTTTMFQLQREQTWYGTIMKYLESFTTIAYSGVIAS